MNDIGEKLLSDIDFEVSAEECFAQLKPHPKFGSCSFENYWEDPRYPSQSEIKNVLKSITAELEGTRKKSALNFFTFVRPSIKPKCVYIDGAYGVGKTHLLASCFNSYSGSKAFLSFSELTYYMNYYGLENTTERFENFRLVLIDEFDLEDPANTRMAARFIDRIKNRSCIVTTSNRLPEELGGGYFDPDSFARELGIIAEAFELITVEGACYRLNKAGWKTDYADATFGGALNGTVFPSPYPRLTCALRELSAVLRSVHPFRFFVIPKNIRTLFIDDFNGFSTLDEALRFVTLIDYCYYYDCKIFIRLTGSDETIFPADMKTTAFERKFLRCESRLREIGAFFKK